jgi:hypothetical protein
MEFLQEWLMNPKWLAAGLVMVYVVLSSFVISFAKPQGGLIPLQKERCEDKFMSLDTDKDGRVSLEEFKAISDKPDDPVEKTFKSRDSNGDGFLTRGECCDRKGGLRSKKTGTEPPLQPQ